MKKNRKTSEAKRVAELRAARRAAGICIHCPTPIVERNRRGELMRACEPCRLRDRRRKRIEQGSQLKNHHRIETGGSYPGIPLLLWEDEIDAPDGCIHLCEHPEEE